MEKSSERWRFRGNEPLNTSADATVTGTFTITSQTINKEYQTPMILLSHGDPGIFPYFCTCPIAEQVVADALTLRISIATLHSSVFFLLGGCSQAMEVILTVLASPVPNILLPRPRFSYIGARHYNLLHWRG